MHIQVKLRACVLIFLLPVTVLFQSGPAHASAVVDESESNVVRARESGETHKTAREPKAVWAACGAFDNAQKLVRDFRDYDRSTDHFRCGNDNWGYRHVKRLHQHDWEKWSAMVGDNWRDFADWCIQETLKAPASFEYRPGNDTWLYIAPFEIRDSDGKVVDRFTTRVIYGNRNRNIITTFPVD